MGLPLGWIMEQTHTISGALLSQGTQESISVAFQIQPLCFDYLYVEQGRRGTRLLPGLKGTSFQVSKMRHRVDKVAKKSGES
jgi:hypothetical protein